MMLEAVQVDTFEAKYLTQIYHTFYWSCIVTRHGRTSIFEYMQGLAYQKDGVPTPPTFLSVLASLVEDTFSSEACASTRREARQHLRALLDKEEYSRIREAWMNGEL